MLLLTAFLYCALCTEKLTSPHPQRHPPVAPYVPYIEEKMGWKGERKKEKREKQKKKKITNKKAICNLDS